MSHVIIRLTIDHFLRWSFGTKLLSLTVSEIFNGEYNATHTA